MPDAEQRKQVAFTYGQVQGLKALVVAMAKSHPDKAALLAEFRGLADLGHSQLRSSPTLPGSLASYRHICDEFVVTIAKAMRIETSKEQVIIL